MEIVREQRTNEVVLKVSGRLDGYWANHLAEAIHDVLREGVHNLRLNLSQTFYVSSGGIRILVEAYKEFVGVGGSLAIVYPSPSVKQVIELSGLGPLLFGGSAGGMTAAAEPQAERIETDGCVFETYSHEPSATLACRAAGRPQLLPQAGFSGRDCEILTLSKDVFALGLGALERAVVEIEYTGHTAHTLTTPQALTDNIRKARLVGYAVDDEELAPEVRCIAAPAEIPGARQFYAIGISGLNSRVVPARISMLAEQVGGAAEEFTRLFSGEDNAAAVVNIR
jgi:anti-anti-sigma factor